MRQCRCRAGLSRSHPAAEICVGRLAISLRPVPTPLRQISPGIRGRRSVPAYGYAAPVYRCNMNDTDSGQVAGAVTARNAQKKDAEALAQHPLQFLLLTVKVSIFGCTQFLYINGMLLCQTLADRRFVELLAGAKLFDDTCTLKFSLEFFEGAFYVFALLHGYYNHFIPLFCFVVTYPQKVCRVQKYAINYYSANFVCNFSPGMAGIYDLTT